MRRTILLTAIVAVIAASAALAKSFPATIALPNGWQPEGIAVGDGSTFYVGSIPTGAVYRGDLRTGKGATLVPGATGRAAIGVEHDRGRLFVAGGMTGKAFVYNAPHRRARAGGAAPDRRRRDVRQRRRRDEARRVLHGLEP